MQVLAAVFRRRQAFQIMRNNKLTSSGAFRI
jgi:hypothetical protein